MQFAYGYADENQRHIAAAEEHMAKSDKFLPFLVGLLLCAGNARAELFTATFAGIATGYNNTASYPGVNFVDPDAWGSMVMDPSKFTYHDGSFYAGEDNIRFTFHVDGRTSTWGGLDPSEGGSGFLDSMTAGSGQKVMFAASSCGFCFSAGLTLAGPSNAFGPDGNLASSMLHPGPVLLDQSSGGFGDRYFGATFALTSVTLSQGATSVTTAVPEPGTYAMLAAGVALLGAASRRNSGRHRLDRR